MVAFVADQPRDGEMLKRRVVRVGRGPADGVDALAVRPTVVRGVGPGRGGAINELAVVVADAVLANLDLMAGRHLRADVLVDLIIIPTAGGSPIVGPCES